MKAALASAAFGLAALSAASPLRAEPTAVQLHDSSAAAKTDAGYELFERHCTLCHGHDGRGHGPVAAALKIAPSDLTQISARNNGEFPAAKVADIIRNGGGVLGHGSSAMLPWGNFFSEKHNPSIGKARIGALVSYLQTLQVK